MILVTCHSLGNDASFEEMVSEQEHLKALATLFKYLGMFISMHHSYPTLYLQSKNKVNKIEKLKVSFMTSLLSNPALKFPSIHSDSPRQNKASKSLFSLFT